MKSLKYVFLGTTSFSYQLLEMLLENNIKPSAVYTLPQSFEISYSAKPVLNYNHADIKGLSDKHGIPCIVLKEKSETNLSVYYDELKAFDLDLILVLGWYYMIPKTIRALSKMGAWGIHASLLPQYAGGAPLVWAIIEGMKETGVTLFKLSDGVDDGDIICQASLEIKSSDTIKELYTRATVASKDILKYALTHFDKVTFKPQIKSEINVYPQRCPDDGELDLTQSAEVLYNFIRAQSSPYPGAFIKTKDGKKLVIEKARVESLE